MMMTVHTTLMIGSRVRYSDEFLAALPQPPRVRVGTVVTLWRSTAALGLQARVQWDDGIVTSLSARHLEALAD